MRPLIYVSGPYTASTSAEVARNVERARQAGLDVRAAGFVPIVPHLAILNDDPRFFNYDKAMDECLQILQRCNGILMIDGWLQSPGARTEQRAAFRHRIPVFYSIADLSDFERAARAEEQIR